MDVSKYSATIRTLSKRFRILSMISGLSLAEALPASKAGHLRGLSGIKAYALGKKEESRVDNKS